jgi:hypothetical protein
MHGFYPMPVSRLRGGLFCFKEVIYMWIGMGYILCGLAKATRQPSNLPSSLEVLFFSCPLAEEYAFLRQL